MCSGGGAKEGYRGSKTQRRRARKARAGEQGPKLDRGSTPISVAFAPFSMVLNDVSHSAIVREGVWLFGFRRAFHGQTVAISQQQSKAVVNKIPEEDIPCPVSHSTHNASSSIPLLKRSPRARQTVTLTQRHLPCKVSQPTLNALHPDHREHVVGPAQISVFRPTPCHHGAACFFFLSFFFDKKKMRVKSFLSEETGDYEHQQCLQTRHQGLHQNSAHRSQVVLFYFDVLLSIFPLSGDRELFGQGAWCICRRKSPQPSAMRSGNGRVGTRNDTEQAHADATVPRWLLFLKATLSARDEIALTDGSSFAPASQSKCFSK